MHAEHAIGRFEMEALLARAGCWPALALKEREEHRGFRIPPVC